MVLRRRAVTCTCKCLMHGFPLVMIQLPIVSVSVGVQRSTPIFQPNNVQCILINQIMLFSVDQCYYIVKWCWSPQIYKHAQCQLAKYMNWPDSLDYKIFWKLELPGKIFLKHYFVINDFSGIVFFKKRFVPHMEVFCLLELSLPHTLIWNFERLAIKGCCVWISSRTAHSDLMSKNISIYPDKLWFSFESWTPMQLYSYKCNQTAWMALWLGLCALLWLAMFQFLV